VTRARQRTLFDGPAFALEEEQSDLFAQVVFSRPMRTIYSYSVPRRLVDAVLAGKRVLAPFGKGSRRTTGFCVGVTDQQPQESGIKPVYAVLDEMPLLAPSMLELTRWIADYYFCSWGQVLDAVLPRAVKVKSGTRWAVYLSPVPESERREPALTVRQHRAFAALCDLRRPATVKEIAQQARCGPECVRSLVEKGWATAVRRRVHHRPPTLPAAVWTKPHTLNEHQQRAFERIVSAVEAGTARTFLLHGVTGSGKTEVYLRAIGEAVRRGREAIVLVPEISLTPQTIERFRQRFDHVAVLHSHLTDSDRNWYWQQIYAGEVQVVVGARSAIFAPCRNLGLIVIDEEHETTFKQETTPRYHAREVGIERSRFECVPLVLGSATPSLESWRLAQTGGCELLSLPNRVADLPMPRVGLIDLRQETGSGKSAALSRPLVEAIRQTLAVGGQVILLLNRRGFCTTILCPQCGHTEKCRHCEVALTLHKELGQLLCHSCDAEFPVPDQCPSCGMRQIRYSGYGTERLEAEIRARFPDVTMARMDSDTMRSAAHYEEVLAGFRRGKLRLLLGTQMIAKGLDVPNVQLVGVVNADVGRNIPDFRAAERTFQLIAQVAGRTGRGESPGRVLVQTFNPADPSILAAANHHYLRFVADELPVREHFGYPPFQKLTRVIVRSKTPASVRRASAIIAERFQNQLAVEPAIRVLGPAPAPIGKLNDYYRMHFQIQSAEHEQRRRFLEAALDGTTLPADVEVAVDVDPISMV
jgi:primosomal protein N' (replication factor Y)